MKENILRGVGDEEGEEVKRAGEEGVNLGEEEVQDEGQP